MAYNADADHEDESDENQYGSLQEMADDLNAQVSESIKTARADAKDYAERFKFQNDGNYYFSVVFKSAHDRDEFLKENGIELDGERFVLYDHFRRHLK